MKSVISITVSLTIAALVSSSATVINIPDDYPTIQQGIDASTDGDTVLVQPGIYVENINFNGHNIVLGSLFLTTRDTSYISQTAIDGDSAYTFDPLVSFVSGEDSTAVITGFSIQNNFGRDYPGGIYCDSSSPSISWNIIRDNNMVGASGAGIHCSDYSSPIISNNRILENVSTVDANGGGIYCENHSCPAITVNIIEGNYGDVGGGIWCSGNSNAVIANNRIAANRTATFGAAIFSTDSEPVIRQNSILFNRSYHSGGAIACVVNDRSIISNNVIAENIASDGPGAEYCKGGGLYCISSDPYLANNIFYNNSADSIGGAIYSSESNPLITNTIIWGNSPDQVVGSPDIFFGNIEGGWPGEGNIDVDPLFRDPENGDFHLMSTTCGDPYDSPCIDAGHPDILDSLLDCSWGLGGPRSDMGAYGGGDSVTVGIDDYDIPIPQEFSLSQNCPNPFNAATVIRYSLPEPSNVTIEIFDILGRKVETLIDEKQQAGYHRIIWNAADRSSGIYLYRIEAGNNAETRKMLLLR
jgi:hypothetical protein